MMKSTSVVRYPVPGVTLHRVASGQRSQGDGEEQTPPHLQASPETTKTLMQASPKLPKGLKEVQHKKKKINKEEKDEDKDTKMDTLSPTIQSEGGHLEDNTTMQSNLPEIIEIASKLTKVSIMSSPDSKLLNTAPKDLDTKKKNPSHSKGCLFQSYSQWQQQHQDTSSRCSVKGKARSQVCSI